MNKNETSGKNIKGRIKFVYAAFPLSKRKQVSVILPSESDALKIYDIE